MIVLLTSVYLHSTFRHDNTQQQPYSEKGQDLVIGQRLGAGAAGMIFETMRSWCSIDV